MFATWALATQLSVTLSCNCTLLPPPSHTVRSFKAALHYQNCIRYWQRIALLTQRVAFSERDSFKIVKRKKGK